ncbi:hypothetical protein JCM8202_005507 [Rhodotorula sphaerocarpa]
MLARSALSSLVRPALAASPAPRLAYAPRLPFIKMASTAAAAGSQAGPVETAIREKLTTALQPTHLEISNDSAAHRHHAPMRAVGGGSGESHFTVRVVSEKFHGLRMIARHRLVNETLKDEFAAGLHALSIKAKSPEEYEAAGNA